jgi:hypothetical protein
MAGPLVPVKVQTVVTNFASVATINQAITVTNAGDTLILTVINRGIISGYAATAVSGAGATWFRLISQTNPTSGPGGIDIWAGINASSGAQTVAITINGTQTSGCNLDEWQYLSNNALIANYLAANSATGSSTSVSVSVTNDSLNEVVYIASSAANTETASPGSFWSTLPGPTSAGAQVAGLCYVVAGAVQSYGGTWTQTTGQWTCVGVVLYPQQGSGDVVWNDPTASVNSGVLAQQASPDMLDFINESLASQGTGVQTGCSVSPAAQSGGSLLYNLGAGTVMVNWNPIPVSTLTAQAMTAADSTRPRKDLVYVDAGGTVHYLAGAPATVPCLPNPPSFPYVMLGEIDVPASAAVFDNGTSTANAHVTDKRVFVGPNQSLADFTAAPQLSGVPVFETHSRRFATNASVLVSGTLFLCAVWLPAGLPVGHISFTTGGTGASTPSHCWYGLWDQNRRQLCLTADQTTTAWAAGTERYLAIASTAYAAAGTTFITPYTGLYYVGICVVASTVPTLYGVGAATVLQIKTPALCGLSTSTLTTPPAYSSTAATAISAGAGTAVPYAYVSR